MKRVACAIVITAFALNAHGQIVQFVADGISFHFSDGRISKIVWSFHVE
jgi:hypothetical protein